MSAAVTPAGGSASGSRASVLGIPAAVLAALPACPACWPLYAGLAGSLGLGVLLDVRTQAYLTIGFLAVSVLALLFRAKRRRGYGPFALGLAATVVVVVAKYVLLIDAMTYAGVGLLVAASLWNVWPRKAVAECAACAHAAMEHMS